MEMRWRGAKGEVGGAEGVEYVRICDRAKLRKAVVGARNAMVWGLMTSPRTRRSLTDTPKGEFDL